MSLLCTCCCSEQKKQVVPNATQNQTPQGSQVKAEQDVKPNSAELLENVLSTNQNGQQKEERSKFGFPQNNNYNVADYRSLVKTLVRGIKTITWGCSACKVRCFKIQ